MKHVGKLKCRPEDFVVTEITGRSPSAGSHGLYKLTKSGLGTPEVLSIICRDWNLSRKQISHAGLKDRHAVTTQYISIQNGPRSNLSGHNFQLDYTGQTNEPLAAQDIRANKFEWSALDTGNWKPSTPLKNFIKMLASLIGFF